MDRGQKWMEGEMKRVGGVSRRLLINNRRAVWRIRHQRPRGNEAVEQGNQGWREMVLY